MTEATARMHARTRVRTSVLSTEFGTLGSQKAANGRNSNRHGAGAGPELAGWAEGQLGARPQLSSETATFQLNWLRWPWWRSETAVGPVPFPSCLPRSGCVGGSWVPGWGCPRPDHQGAAQPGDLAPGETAWKCTVGDDDRA